jgi:hypothetical protein
MFIHFKERMVRKRKRRYLSQVKCAINIKILLDIIFHYLN